MGATALPVCPELDGRKPHEHGGILDVSRVPTPSLDVAASSRHPLTCVPSSQLAPMCRRTSGGHGSPYHAQWWELVDLAIQGH